MESPWGGYLYQYYESVYACEKDLWNLRIKPGKLQKRVKKFWMLLWIWGFRMDLSGRRNCFKLYSLISIIMKE